jgi:hypothetical protein
MIELINKPEHVELVKAMGSRNGPVSAEAAEAFAAGIWPVVQLVLQQAGTVSLIYNDYGFDENTAPTIPLDFLHGEGANVVQTWSASMGGGLPTNETYTSDEARVSYYDIDSAVSFRKKFARASNLPILSNSVERMINEILVKQELQGWAVIMAALGAASTLVNGSQQVHTKPAGTAGVFLLDDLSNLITLSRRINTSYAQGTPVVPYSKGITDLFVSPEIKAQIRAFAYNPMNTKPGPTVAGSTLANYTATTAVALPDAVRQTIYDNAGTADIFGINITDLNELGKNAKYNALFAVYAQGTPAPGGNAFTSSGYEVLVGIDLTRKAYARAVETNGDTGGTVTVNVDDQFPLRSDKVGFWAAVREGRVSLDARSTLGLIV